MTVRRHHNRLAVALTLAASVLAVGCQLGAPTGAGGGAEDTLNLGGKGKVANLPALATRDLRLTSRDGKPLHGVVVQIGGKNLTVRNGVVKIPEDAWAEAQKAGRLVILGAGFLPLALPLDGDLTAEILLTPTDDLGKPGLVSQAGGTLASAGDQALITIPASLLTGGTTTVRVGTYQPTLGVDAQAAFERDVAAFIQARDRAIAASGGGAATTTGGAAGGCGAPFVCAPATAGLGVSVTVDGPIQAGQITVSLDLAKLMNGWDGIGDPPASFTDAQRADAIAASRILQTFANFDATNDPTWRQVMRETYGITLDHTLLTFPVRVGDATTAEGLARVEVDGLAVLGARLEVTLLSSAAGTAPGALGEAVPISPGDVPLSMIQSKIPGYVEDPRLQLLGGGTAGVDNGPDAIATLVANNGGQLRILDDDTSASFSAAELLTNNGGALISNATGGVALIANNSGGLISNNSGGLVSNNSGGIVSSNGSGFVSNNSGGLVSNNSGGLISNNSGGFTAPTITGYPFFPFEPSQGKYQLLQVGPPVPSNARATATGLIEYLWPGQTRVRAIMANGAPITGWTPTDGSGEFELKLPENSPIVFFLQCELLVRGSDNLPRFAYAMAFAPGKKRTTDVAVDASTTMVATSTLHLLDYIPPEYQRLTGLADSFEKKTKDIVDSLPEGVDLNAVAGGSGSGSGSGTGGNGNGNGNTRYHVFQANGASPSPSPSTTPSPRPSTKATPTPVPTVDPKILEAKKLIDLLKARMNLIDGRVGELSDAWEAFNPFQYGADLGHADQTVTDEMAKRISNAASLRAAYDPMYGVAATNGFAPESYRAINPDSPPETYIVPAE